MKLLNRISLATLLLAPLGTGAGTVLLWTPTALAAETEPLEMTDASLLSGERLPAQASRARAGGVFSQMDKALAKLLAAVVPTARQGRTEVLAWDTEKTGAARLMDETHNILRRGGWNVQTEKAEMGLVLMTARRQTPAPRVLFGLWAPEDEAVVLAWTEVLDVGKGKSQQPETQRSEQQPEVQRVEVVEAARGGDVLEIDPDAMFVDVMQGTAPKMPAFRPLQKKPGFLRGWVKNAAGQPLKGAKISVTSTAIGGAETQVNATSDEQGLYEVELPSGACKVWTAGHVLTLSGVRCALPLHPVDGEFDSFASRKGEVENLVLLPFGVADEAEASQYPQQEDFYYGAAITGVYWSGNVPDWLPEGATLEITLSPTGAMLDGRKGRSFVIRHRVRKGDSQTFRINNIPAAPYRMSARLLEGGRSTLLVMEETNKALLPGGLKPKSASGSATFLPRPKTADAKSPVVHVCGWRNVVIEFKRPG